MKISASIYSNKEKNLEQLVRELDAHNIDLFHVDCADDEKVFDDIVHIRKISKTPIDLHIISATPEKYFDRIKELNIEYVCFQYENLEKLPQLPTNTNTKFGISIISSTGVDALERNFTQGDSGYTFLLMMCTVPGKSGGVFNRDNFQKIIEFKYRFPKMKMHVDGGVNDEIAYILRLLGVNAIVSGSYLLNHESLGAGMLSLHTKPNEKNQSFPVTDFAIPLKYLPVLDKTAADFKNVLQAIEKYGLGFVAISDTDGKLEGIVSNADVRRGLLANIDNVSQLKVESLINQKPVTIQAKATLTDMIRLLNELNFIVLFLPVTDEENKLKGAVLLNNLTRV